MNRKPLPERAGRVRRKTGTFHGIDRRHGAPFGSLRGGVGALCEDGKTLRGAPSWERVYDFPDTLYPQSLTAIGGGIFAMCRQLDRITEGSYLQREELQLLALTEDGTVYLSQPMVDRQSGDDMPLLSDLNGQRSMVQFNVYSEGGQLSDAVGGTYDRKLLIFPDKMSADLPVTEDGFLLSRMDEERDGVPDLHYVTVQGGRLFGVDAGRIYAGAYNDPWNWDVDTPDDIGAENAWVTTTGADTRGDGDFTAICAYDGEVWAMKGDFGHIVSGGSNPFTVKDTDVIGAIDARAVVRGDGRLFFVRDDGVRMAKGSTVSRISDPLCIDGYSCGICTYRDGTLYMAEGGVLYAYHVKSDTWSALPLPEGGEVLSLVSGERGVYVLMQVNMWENRIWRLSGQVGLWQAELCPTDFSSDTDMGPATLTLHATAQVGTKVTLSLRENSSGRVLELGSQSGTGRDMRFRTHIRGGAGHSYTVLISVEGDAVIRGLSLTARNGVRDDG